jgi:hypothetical protein
MKPSPALFRHFMEQARGLTGSVYGRRTYEVRRIGDENLLEWGTAMCQQKTRAPQQFAALFDHLVGALLEK